MSAIIQLPHTQPTIAYREQQLRSEIALLRRLYDKKSETLNAAQLELLLDPESAKKPTPPILKPPDRRQKHPPPKSLRRVNPKTSPTFPFTRLTLSPTKSKPTPIPTARSTVPPPTASLTSVP
jgi:hypothetical protein